MKNETITKEYEGKNIRCVYDNGKYYYSIVDVISVITKSERARKYWNDIKGELIENDIQLSGKIGQLKMEAADKKYRLTDVIDEENLIELINYIPSKGKEKFIKWIEEDREIEKVENGEIIPYNGQKITNLIYEIRGKEVMLDSDLAQLYQCKNGTKEINQAVKRNIKRFPERFMFQLTKSEYNECLRSQIVTLDVKRGQYSKYLPYVFTEEGVAMLATVLNTKVADDVSVAIMDAFVIMRKYISKELIEQRYINRQVFKNSELIDKNAKDIKVLQDSFKKLEEKRKENEIYFNGQIYDAYSKIIDIFKKAKKELIIIDGYADKVVLDMIRGIKVPVKIICYKNKLLKEIDIRKYQSQYHNLEIIYSNIYHDRYFIIDKEEVYHCGASLNHLGSKTFSINILQDDDIKKLLIKKVDT